MVLPVCCPRLRDHPGAPGQPLCPHLITQACRSHLPEEAVSQLSEPCLKQRGLRRGCRPLPPSPDPRPPPAAPGTEVHLTTIPGPWELLSNPVIGCRDLTEGWGWGVTLAEWGLPWGEAAPIKSQTGGFPGGSVKNLPASARDTGSILDPGRSHMAQNN